MSKLAKAMFGVWVSVITTLVIELMKFTWPELSAESVIPYGIFFVFSVLTVVSIWTSE